MYFVIYHTPDNEKDLVVNTERLMVCAKPDTLSPAYRAGRGLRSPVPPWNPVSPPVWSTQRCSIKHGWVEETEN